MKRTGPPVSRVIAHGLLEQQGDTYQNPHGMPRKPAAAVVQALKRNRKSIVECGCCGEYHSADWPGDCRNDAERFDCEVEGLCWDAGVDVITLEEQLEQEAQP